jgi:hypothetical protein
LVKSKPARAVPAQTREGQLPTRAPTDAATAARLQKMAEAMRLMHEAMTE